MHKGKLLICTFLLIKIRKYPFRRNDTEYVILYCIIYENRMYENLKTKES